MKYVISLVDGINGTSPGYLDPDPWKDFLSLSGPYRKTDPPRFTRFLPDYNPSLENFNLFTLYIKIIRLLYLIISSLKTSFLYYLIAEFITDSLRLFLKLLLNENFSVIKSVLRNYLINLFKYSIV